MQLKKSARQDCRGKSMFCQFPSIFDCSHPSSATAILKSCDQKWPSPIALSSVDILQTALSSLTSSHLSCLKQPIASMWPKPAILSRPLASRQIERNSFYQQTKAGLGPLEVFESCKWLELQISCLWYMAWLCLEKVKELICSLRPKEPRHHAYTWSDLIALDQTWSDNMQLCDHHSWGVPHGSRVILILLFYLNLHHGSLIQLFRKKNMSLTPRRWMSLRPGLMSTWQMWG